MTVATAEVVNYYNKSWARWEKQVGENCHHGYYGPGDPVNASTLPDSQIRMTDEVLKFASISDGPLKKPKNIIDVGCAMGGTGRYFVKKFGAYCCGVDLSPVQIRRAQELTVATGLQDKMSFIVGDALDQPFPDRQFDLVWAFDVIDHTPYKLKFVSELVRIAAPGATIIITAGCHRDLSPGEESLKPDEKNLLNKICKQYHLPLSCSPSDYVKIAQSLALQVLASVGFGIFRGAGIEEFKMANWSEHVTPFWEAINQSYWTLRGLTSLLLSGWDEIKWALALPTVLEAYNKKLISYNVIACRKGE